jgi:hypothetical protein
VERARVGCPGRHYYSYSRFSPFLVPCPSLSPFAISVPFLRSRVCAYVCASSRDRKSKINSDGTRGRKYRRGGDEREGSRGNQERDFYQN